jgi:hypothetical protein
VTYELSKSLLKEEQQQINAIINNSYSRRSNDQVGTFEYHGLSYKNDSQLNEPLI